MHVSNIFCYIPILFAVSQIVSRGFRMFPKKIFGTNKDILIIPRDKLYLQMRFDNCFVTLEDIGEGEAVDC